MAKSVGSPNKATRVLLLSGAGGLLVIAVGGLLLFFRSPQAQPAKEPCPESEPCNARLRPYKQEVGTDIPDLFPTWFRDAPSATWTGASPMSGTTSAATSTQLPERLVTPGSAPLAQIAENARCRKGAGTEYDVTAFLPQGTIATIVGRNADWSWWMTQPPGQDARCWVWAELVTTGGDTSQVPFAASPPLPTHTSVPELGSHPIPGCWVYTVQNPNGECLPRACTPNDFPGTPCSP